MEDRELIPLYLQTKTIAVIGLSNDPDRPSFGVASYLKEQGFTIIPVNPKYSVVLGEKCFSDLTSAVKETAPMKIDMVDIFRKPEFVGPHVDEAIAHKIPVVWMQEGIEHLDGAAKATQAGIKVVMNRCLMKEHKRLKSLGLLA